MELSILAYARFHGVARDHQGLDPLSSIPHTPTNLAASLDDPDDPYLVTMRSAQLTAEQKQRERLDITKSGAMFLSSILQTPTLLEKAGSEICWDDLLPDHRRIKRLKVEGPLLKGDHELDMRAFRNQPNLNQVAIEIPIEQLDDEKDEGLGFPTYCKELPGQMQDMITREKLDCSREVLHFMQEIRKSLSSSTDDAHQQVYDKIRWSPKKRCGPITPPLLPCEPSTAPFIPTSSSLEVGLCSELEPRALPEYEGIDRLLAEDLELNVGTARKPADRAQGRPFLTLLGYSPSMPPNPTALISPKRPLPDDLKVDSPITPPISTKKRCLQEQGKSLDDLLHGVSFPSWRAPGSEHEQLLEGELDEAVQSSIIEIEERLKSKCLRQIETTVRPKVPDLETPQVTPPWASILESRIDPPDSVQCLYSKLIANYDLTSGFRLEPQDERQLPWNPFPAGIKRPDVKETTHNPPVLDEFLVNSDLTVDGNHVMFIPARLPPLQDDMEDEILLRDFTKELNADRLNRGFTDVPPRNVTDALEFDIATARNLRNSAERESISGTSIGPARAGCLSIYPQRSSLFGSNFSTRWRLAKFMNVRGQTFYKPGIQDSPYLGLSLPPTNEVHHGQQTHLDAENKELDSMNDIRDLILPIPDSSPPSTRTLVLSCSLLRSHRALVRDLEALVPPATLVFRDYGKPIPSWPARMTQSSPSTISPGSANGQSDGAINSGNNEADIVLSPTVGILLANSQETTQLYLPGHQHSPTSLGVKCDSPLRERISKACVRYEKIYLLICHPSLTNGNKFAMDSKTANSIRSLQSFCRALSPHCQITFLLVPTSASSLMQWITSLSDKHSFILPSWAHGILAPGTSLVSPEDPTVPELALQRAGLNPFAAQVVLYLCSLRALGTTSKEFPFSEGEFALQSAVNRRKLPRASLEDAVRNFVNMDPYERQGKFAPILGSRVLSRVEKQLGILQAPTILSARGYS